MRKIIPLFLIFDILRVLLKFKHFKHYISFKMFIFKDTLSKIIHCLAQYYEISETNFVHFEQK